MTLGFYIEVIVIESIVI